MGFWNWLKNIKKAYTYEPSQASNEEIQAAFGRVKQDMQRLETQINILQTQWQQQQNLLQEQHLLLESQMGRVAKLEELLLVEAIPAPPLSPTGKPPTNRLIHPAASRPVPASSPAELDWEYFSPTEKKILGVFLRHRDLALSYQDLAKALTKSPHTIKNQVHQISIKADVLDETLGVDSRKRFKLKKNLKLAASLPDQARDDSSQPNDQE